MIRANFIIFLLLACPPLRSQVQQFFTPDSLAAITSPLGVDSLFYWFDAGAGVLDSLGGAIATDEGVGTWQDQSGNGRHVTQTTNTDRPVYKATGGPGSKPCIQFDGTDDFLASAAHFWGSDDITIFVVVKHNNATLNQQESIIARLQTTTNERQWVLFAREGALSYRNQFNWYNTGAAVNAEFREAHTGTKSAAWKLSSIVKNDADNTLVSWHYDAVAQSVSYVASATGNNTILDDADNKTSIGAVNVRSTPANFLQGSISEIIVYSKALSATERAAIENYLNKKYDLY